MRDTDNKFDRCVLYNRTVQALTASPYQMLGIAFLMPRHAALLADEMGLGKTAQANENETRRRRKCSIAT